MVGNPNFNISRIQNLYDDGRNVRPWDSFTKYKTCIAFILIVSTSFVLGQVGKCDQTPLQAKVLTPSENNGTFKLMMENKKQTLTYMPEQTYVVTLASSSTERPFRWFMITAEDPTLDNSTHEIGPIPVDVGSLKTLDTEIGRKSRYSERCFSSVENTDSSDKYTIEIHWISPRNSDIAQKVRLRAMVAENEEVWYTGGEHLTVMLEKDTRPPLDSPPFPASPICRLCSEARYEVVFQGRWSRLRHPLHYPSKPDENGYSHMIGASHAYGYKLWQQGMPARNGLRNLVEKADVDLLEREIIDAMTLKPGTRTLIRGKRRHHPLMSEPSSALFRVDRIHHLFSLVVAMRPSPDWFLGTNDFELCTNAGWLEKGEIPLYPWDAGTMDGVSYESKESRTEPVDSIKRVEVGSFNRESPFYQLNLNDLQPFAILTVRRLSVYPLEGEDCSQDEDEDMHLLEEGNEE